MPASGGSGGFHKKHKRGGGGSKPSHVPSTPSGHRPYGGGHTAPSGNVGVGRKAKSHRRKVKRAAQAATQTQQFKQAASHPAKSSYAQTYGPSVAQRQQAHEARVAARQAAKYQPPKLPTNPGQTL